ncbi:MAG: phosphoglycerate mutase [Halioglobus sp.]|nr:phosphoglycerate mutase [Halioglobus sp.]
MKTLRLTRHAKSSWTRPELDDRERGLNKRGRRDLPRMAAALSARLEPSIIHASPARRAQLTLEGLCAHWPALAQLPHVSDEDLYTFAAADLLDWLAQRPDTTPDAWIIGHNPALTSLVNHLAPGAGLDNLPTCGFVELQLGVDHWDQLMQGAAKVTTRLFPKQLRDPDTEK